MIGFVGLSMAVLLALSLLSYSPHDPSFQRLLPAAFGGPGAQLDWPGGSAPGGPVLPVLRVFGLFVSGGDVCGHRCGGFAARMWTPRSRSWWAAWCCSISLSAELSLIHMPGVRGALPAGGLLGTAAAEGLRAGFNPVGANLVSLMLLTTSVLLTTTFSFRMVMDWMKKPMSAEGYIGKMIAQREGLERRARVRTASQARRRDQDCGAASREAATRLLRSQERPKNRRRKNLPPCQPSRTLPSMDPL